MANKNRQMVDKLKDIMGPPPKPGQGGESATPPPTGILEDRLRQTKELAADKRFRKLYHRVAPEKIKVPDNHNRRYDLLNDENCADLINSFRELGKQEIPAIARRLEDDPDYTHELILGARRHWTATYLGWDLVIEERDLSNEEAFRLRDVENRARADISDYERALDYKKALESYYESQRQMATRMEVSHAWLNYYILLATLPQEVVDAYPSITEIKVRHARELTPLLSNPVSREKILQAALEIKAQRAAGQAAPKDGAGVLRALKESARRSGKRKAQPRIYTGGTGGEVARIISKYKNHLKLDFDLQQDDEALVSAFKEALTDARTTDKQG
ncbi:ParB/RepB/Spo0J family partition protein [Thioalkalivibrio thiocyanodenitrificans]|uniref:ParB/RepB/Spo0J family partition protein n=1 Tax=Thioalkalivibrio thiocyanodenitrificans TaxID=243063 RepID=UPI00037E4D45|nr:ParB/RepB/Spo0J family partition protein [Thioalkalivibrio thiocyanodenitrificans]